MALKDYLQQHNVVDMIKQSAPVDVSAPYNPDNVSGNTVVITGGASGFGAAFARRWASHGANVIIGDINDTGGQKLVAELRASTGSQDHHYQHCDVRDWQSQVSLFQAAARLSVSGGIDAVVANAGIRDMTPAATGLGFENPYGLDIERPPPPELKVLDVNLTGVMYTTHLALFWLAWNDPARDRHLLLLGSVASFLPLSGQVLYGTSKHAVMGLFRTLRGSSWRQGVRINMVCPYFADTAIVPNSGHSLVAGCGLAAVPDVVDAATRLMADKSIVGRALVIGPRLRIQEGREGEVGLVAPGTAEDGKPIWECYAHDYESVEIFSKQYLRLLNTLVWMRGWAGWFKDMARIWVWKKDRTA
ncbi:uncharacterized protein E0L32_011314 [Thyridium curvatum]|uniref:Uncharacterized protein n=1 Tax=Thyridium curvatum TaxID=1093900 RepID=A0A507BGB5_9PEZI|nr:uncharacterized protein E0L32_011314 [Thyridium curvatum]TPX18997.1 hypothetical protein E0L32_011314 [Thyridium curvatum]